MYNNHISMSQRDIIVAMLTLIFCLHFYNFQLGSARLKKPKTRKTEPQKRAGNKRKEQNREQREDKGNFAVFSRLRQHTAQRRTKIGKIWNRSWNRYWNRDPGMVPVSGFIQGKRSLAPVPKSPQLHPFPLFFFCVLFLFIFCNCGLK